MANSDIFSRAVKSPSGAFSIDSAELTFDGIEKGLLVQNIQLQYQQQVTLVYDLTKPEDVYYVAGRSQGTMSLGKVVGPGGTVKQFYTTYGNVCNIQKSFTMRGLGGCSDPNFVGPPNPNAIVNETFIIHNPVVTSVGFSMTVDNALVSEQAQLIFASLEIG